MINCDDVCTHVTSQMSLSRTQHDSYPVSHAVGLVSDNVKHFLICLLIVDSHTTINLTRNQSLADDWLTLMLHKIKTERRVRKELDD
jgi:hypothetical protein